MPRSRLIDQRQSLLPVATLARAFGAIAAGVIICLAAAIATVTAAAAQGTQDGWSTGTQASPALPSGNDLATTILPRQPAAPAPQPPPDPGSAVLTLAAYLTADGSEFSRKAIDRGLVWRIFTLGAPAEPAKLILTRRDATPTVKLAAGQYAINAAFGRAHLTQVVTVRGGTRKREAFVLNAGGLRVIIRVHGGRAASDKARYDIFSDERDQSGNRLRIISNARPGLITRLNSGIYHIISRLGDANALVSAEVVVEAGKLTEAVVTHEAAKVTFKLVKTDAGEAHADTQWTIMTKGGDIIKESAGALPTHILAPGSYNVSARRQGHSYSREFTVESGQNVEIEVLMQ